MPRSILALMLITVLSTTALAAPRLLELPGPDATSLMAEDKRLDDDGLERFAWPAEVTLKASDGGGWDRLDDGRHRWRLDVRAPGSLSLNFGFGHFRLPWGATLTVEGERGPIRRFTSDDNQDHGELWTPVVLGDDARLTLILPPGQRDDFELEMIHVGRGYKIFDDGVGDIPGYCNIDVICSEGDEWRRQIRSVGVYTRNGIWVCTGSMLNNTRNDGTPYFLTASHCNIDEDNAPSVVVYWNFESPVCGDLFGGNLDDAQTGAIWRADYSPADMSLIEMSARPDTSWHVSYGGWDRTGNSVPEAVAIHHPSTGVKCISFEDDALEITSYNHFEVPGDGTHWRVIDWDLGTTEGGSSGSPLYDEHQRVVGQLHGGAAACGNNASDWYGRLSESWAGGATDDSRLSNWLDPAGTGAMVLNIYDPMGPPIIEPDPVFSFTGARPNPYVGSQVPIQFSLDEPGHARMTIFDLRGRRTALLVDQNFGEGEHTVIWDAKQVASGAYRCRLETSGMVLTKWLTLIK